MIMSLKEQIEEMETKMNDAWERVNFGDDGATYEEIADGYQVAFSLASNVVDNAIKLLKQLDNQKGNDVNS